MTDVPSPPVHHPAVAHELARAGHAQLRIADLITRVIERLVREIHETVRND
jgi:hypothetical protein